MLQLPQTPFSDFFMQSTKLMPLARTHRHSPHPCRQSSVISCLFLLCFSRILLGVKRKHSTLLLQCPSASWPLSLDDTPFLTSRPGPCTQFVFRFSMSPGLCFPLLPGKFPFLAVQTLPPMAGGSSVNSTRQTEPPQFYFQGSDHSPIEETSGHCSKLCQRMAQNCVYGVVCVRLGVPSGAVRAVIFLGISCGY
jgi:hypothetical protein